MKPVYFGILKNTLQEKEDIYIYVTSLVKMYVSDGK